MITGFANKETEKIYNQIFSKKLPGDIQRIALRKMILINNAGSLEETMADYIISTPTMGEILREDFMKPMNVSAYKLAKEIRVPVSRIQAILDNNRRITVDTSLRLAKYFGVSDRYFLDIQNDIDIRNLKISMKSEIDSIKPAKDEAI